MAVQNYDLLIVGGGIAGASLAGVVAKQGAQVLVLESETRFRDRVRGEAIMPWGVVEARVLDIYDVLVSAGAVPITYWDTYQGADRTGHRNLVNTTSLKEHILACYHPSMQEALLQWAQDSGATVLRGARARALDTGNGEEVAVEVEIGGRSESVAARMVVGADGRGSAVRAWAGFQVNKDPDRNLVAGLLLENVDLSEDAAHAWLQAELGYFVFHWPQGNGLARAYLCSSPGSGSRLSGAGDFQRFLEGCVAAGVPAEVYSRAKAVGPLATFDGAGAWSDNAYQRGVALIGDAASNSDPTWGQGLAMALRDVRVLAQALADREDWEAAGNAYSQERSKYRTVIRTVEDWQSSVLMDTGPEADALRDKVLPSWSADRSRHPDTFIAGPGPVLDETARRRFFGED